MATSTTFRLTLVKPSGKHLDEVKLAQQVQAIRLKTVGRGLKSNGWTCGLAGNNWKPSDGPNKTLVYKAQLVLKNVSKRARSKDVVEREYEEAVKAATAAARTVQWEVSQTNDTKAALKPEVYSNVEVPKDWMRHFKHIYGREDQINLVLSAIHAGIRSDWHDRFHRVLVGDPAGGKAQPLRSKILTPSGWKRMKDVKVGDILCHPSGGTTVVRGVFPQGVKRIYKVTFSDGSTARCCADHLWFTETRYHRKESMRKDLRGRSRHQTFARGEVRKTREIAASLLSTDGHTNHYIPVVEPQPFTRQDQPLDPYVMGLLLGNGNFTRQGFVRFTSSDDFVVGEMRRRMPEDTVMVQLETFNNFRFRGKTHGSSSLPLVIADLGLVGKSSPEKFVPRCYLWGDVEQRTLILQGLFDTDGTTHNGTPAYSTSSKQLAKDVVFLVRSLGGTARVSSKLPTYTYEGEKRYGRTSYTIHANLPPEVHAFRLPRKAELLNERRVKFPSRSILSVVPLRKEECQCVSVSATDGLYVTNDFVVTHNTEILRAVAQFVGPDACLIYDATATTQAGAIKDISERQELPRIMVIEEIEKVDESSLRWLLGVLDHRAEIRKTTYRGTTQRSVKMLCLATVNDYKLFKGMMSGALASRFGKPIWCPRPDETILRMILKREVDRIKGKAKWIDKTVEYVVERGITDPRVVIQICLCGRDDLLDGTYQKMLDNTDLERHAKAARVKAKAAATEDYLNEEDE